MSIFLVFYVKSKCLERAAAFQPDLFPRSLACTGFTNLVLKQRLWGPAKEGVTPNTGGRVPRVGLGGVWGVEAGRFRLAPELDRRDNDKWRDTAREIYMRYDFRRPLGA